MEYDLPLFRPPSEARSLIFQVTLGCSWNRCLFCTSYGTKEFQPITGMTLAGDKDGILGRIDMTLADTSPDMLRPEWMRGL